MRSRCGALAAPLMMLAIGCTWVDPGDCWVNTSGGFGGGGTIPVVAAVGATTGGDFFSPPQSRPLDARGTPNPCMASDTSGEGGNRSQGGTSSRGGAGTGSHVLTPDEEAVIALERADPAQLARAQLMANYAAYAIARMTDAQVGDSSTVDVGTLQRTIAEEAPTAWSAAEQWIMSEPPVALSSPCYPINVECLAPPSLCKSSVKCDFAKTCVLDDCGDGKCKRCPDRFGLGNLVISGWCTYLCYDTSKGVVGVALNFRPRIGSNIVEWIKVCLANP
jgi:hypothetical protein